MEMIIVKVFLGHVSFFIVLIFLSLVSFVMIFGAGFGGDINILVLFTPFTFSVFWLIGYTWFILRTNPDKINWVLHPSENWGFIIFLLSGIFTAYCLFLTLFFGFIPMFGSSIIILIIWYWLLYRYIKNKNKGKYTQWLPSTILFILALIYAIQMFRFYLINT